MHLENMIQGKGYLDKNDKLVMQPFDFLLLDEPYSHLDEVNRKKAMELIYEECEKRDAAMVFADLKPLDFLKDERVVYL